MVLIPQSSLKTGHSAEGWHLPMFAQLSERLSPPSDFPCLFSQNAFRRELLLFSFVETLSQADLARAGEDLSAYIAICRQWDGSLSSAQPLVMAFSLDAAPTSSLAEYHRIGWNVLQFWHDTDPAPWPDNVAHDADSPFWSMCYEGMQLFVNMSNPAHQARKSRNLGDYFLFIINPRERFDIVAGDTPEGQKVRARIRGRIENYDGLSHCLQLGSYEAGEIEWWQYGILEENIERQDKCPFRFRETGVP